MSGCPKSWSSTLIPIPKNHFVFILEEPEKVHYHNIALLSLGWWLWSDWEQECADNKLPVVYPMDNDNNWNDAEAFDFTPEKCQ